MDINVNNIEGYDKLDNYTKHIAAQVIFSLKNKRWTLALLAFRPFLIHIYADISDESIDEIISSRYNFDEIVQGISDLYNFSDDFNEKIIEVKNISNKINHEFQKATEEDAFACFWILETLIGYL